MHINVMYKQTNKSDMIANIHFLKNIQVLDIQNISLFIIALCSFYCHAHYYFCVNDSTQIGIERGECTKPFHALAPFVCIHAFVDLFFVRSIDMILHHLFTLGNIFYLVYCGVSDEHSFVFFYTCLKTEISSIFYVLKYWLPSNTVAYNLNLLVFYVLFFKFRIYDYYYELIYNNIQFDILCQRYSQSNVLMSSVVIISCYGLYILNMYWFFIMTKIIYKVIAKITHIDTDIICHHLTSYLYWLNIPLAWFVYSYSQRQIYIFDMAGIICLSISSYLYHIDVYTRLSNKQIETYTIPIKDNIVLFINDSIAINIRTIITVIINYYDSPNFYLVFLLSGVVHLSSIYHTFLNILELFIDYDKNKDTFLNIHNIITAIPIAFDVVLGYINYPIEIATPYLIVNIAIACLYLVNPFYKLTHVAFHFLLFAQTYYICLTNSK